MVNKRKRTPLFLSAAALVAAATAFAAAQIFDPVERLDKRHCVVDRVPETTLVVAIDISDPLVAVQPREVSFEVGQALAALTKGDRILVIDAAGKPPTEVMPVVDQCAPGADTNVARNAFKNAVLAPIADHLQAVKSKPPSSQSPIIETILSTAGDSSLHAARSHLVVLCFTDGLQNSDLQSAYKPGSKFPKLDGAPLNGVTIKLRLVPNERDLALQPKAVDNLIAWLKEAGADVEFTPPPWLLLAKAKYGGGRR